ncbi:hypothetical protein BpHYR1_047539 [Brachionus plicatilis]|uniref:RNA-directed DNA polymerase from mobile element jockey-like n=1 Tax=Brachionus plicatilis TaxID=10195 RepID=A0A3M7PM81_BRAPC|nr:hypothetical protein BpHYR1_047539 [Brachionus plicatilis]
MNKLPTNNFCSVSYQALKIFKNCLPPNIVSLIKQRRKIRRIFQKTRCQNTKDSTRWPRRSGSGLISNIKELRTDEKKLLFWYNLFSDKILKFIL